MKNKKLLIGIIVILLLVAIVVYYVPWPSRIELTMQGAEVTLDGTVIESGEFVLHGTKYNYLFKRDSFKLHDLQLPNREVGRIMDSTRSIANIEMYGVYLTSVWVELPEYTSPNNLYTGWLVFSPDQSYWVLELTGRVFVGSTQEDADYAAIMEQCCDLIDG